jgi:hypothetical protein
MPLDGLERVGFRARESAEHHFAARIERQLAAITFPPTRCPPILVIFDLQRHIGVLTRRILLVEQKPPAP